MTQQIENELAKLRKDVAGLSDISGDLKDQLIELEEANQVLHQTISDTHAQFIQGKKEPKGLSRAALTLLKNMQAQVTKIEAHMLNDQQYIRNANRAMQDMAVELRNTVAANDG